MKIGGCEWKERRPVLTFSLCRPAAGRRERQRRRPVGHQRGQEHGVRPADGLVAAPADRLHPAQCLQPNGDFLGLVPTQGEPLHPLPRLLRLRRGGGLGGEVREEKHQGKMAKRADGGRTGGG